MSHSRITLPKMRTTNHSLHTINRHRPVTHNLRPTRRDRVLRRLSTRHHITTNNRVNIPTSDRRLAITHQRHKIKKALDGNRQRRYRPKPLRRQLRRSLRCTYNSLAKMQARRVRFIRRTHYNPYNIKNRFSVNISRRRSITNNNLNRPLTNPQLTRPPDK